MGKIDKNTRDKAIELLANYLADAHSDKSSRDTYEYAKDMNVNGHEGFVDYTDEELLEEFNSFFEDPEEGTAEYDLVREMEAQIAIETYITS